MYNFPVFIDLRGVKQDIKYFRPIINPQGPAEVALAGESEICHVLINLFDEASTIVRCAEFYAKRNNTTSIPYSEYNAVIDSAIDEITRMKDRCLQELIKLQADRGETALKHREPV
ncbi:hypothetical protein ACFLVJ_01375 [Chloroflexota bacterium]